MIIYAFSGRLINLIVYIAQWIHAWNDFLIFFVSIFAKQIKVSPWTIGEELCFFSYNEYCIIVNALWQVEGQAHFWRTEADSQSRSTSEPRLFC